MLKGSQCELSKTIHIFYDRHFFPSGVLNICSINSFMCYIFNTMMA